MKPARVIISVVTAVVVELLPSEHVHGAGAEGDRVVGSVVGAAVVGQSHASLTGDGVGAAGAGAGAASSLQKLAGQYLGTWLQFTSHHESVHVLFMHL